MRKIALYVSGLTTLVLSLVVCSPFILLRILGKVIASVSHAGYFVGMAIEEIGLIANRFVGIRLLRVVDKLESKIRGYNE